MCSIDYKFTFEQSSEWKCNWIWDDGVNRASDFVLNILQKLQELKSWLSHQLSWMLISDLPIWATNTFKLKLEIMIDDSIMNLKKMISLNFHVDMKHFCVIMDYFFLEVIKPWIWTGVRDAVRCNGAFKLRTYKIPLWNRTDHKTNSF